MPNGYFLKLGVYTTKVPILKYVYDLLCWTSGVLHHCGQALLDQESTKQHQSDAPNFLSAVMVSLKTFSLFNPGFKGFVENPSDGTISFGTAKFT